MVKFRNVFYSAMYITLAKCMIKRPCFLKKSNALIGLEFNPCSLLWTELSHSKEKIYLESYAQIPISVQNFLSPDETEQAEIIHALKQVVAKLNPRTRQTCICVDYSSVLFKTLELDKNLMAEEIQCYLQQQAEKYFNFPPNELMFDFNILGPSTTDEGLVKIQWVAAKRHDLSLWLNIFNQAGLKPVIVDINSCALQRSALFSLNNETDTKLVIAAIHLYTQSFLLVIFDQEKQLLVRHEKFAVDTPALECITRCLQLNSWRYESPISQILLSGSLIGSEGIYSQQSEIYENLSAKSMQEKIGIKTSIPSFFSELPHSDRYAISIGLGLRVQP
jgi:type IV pilus assembly protein PilM